MENDAKLEPVLRANLLMLARAYAKHHGYKLSTVASYATGDPRFFENLTKARPSGRKSGFTIRTYDEFMAYFLANWPAELAVPATIWRPGEPLPAEGK